jgi:hypothetical protein
MTPTVFCRTANRHFTTRPATASVHARGVR